MSQFIARISARTAHIDLAAAPGDRTNTARHYAKTSCAALTRGASRMTLGRHEYGDLETALGAIRLEANLNGRSLCKHCEKAAERAIAAHKADALARLKAPKAPAPAAPAAERTVADDLADLEAGTEVHLYLTDGTEATGTFEGLGRSATIGGPRVEAVTIRRDNGKRATIAVIMVDMFELFVDADGGTWATPEEIRAAAAAEAHVDTEREYTDARADYMRSIERAEHSGAADDEAAAAAAWDRVTAATTAAGKCLWFPCHAPAAEGRPTCLPHTDPAKRIAPLDWNTDADGRIIARAGGFTYRLVTAGGRTRLLAYTGDVDPDGRSEGLLCAREYESRAAAEAAIAGGIAQRLTHVQALTRAALAIEQDVDGAGAMLVAAVAAAAPGAPVKARQRLASAARIRGAALADLKRLCADAIARQDTGDADQQRAETDAIVDAYRVSNERSARLEQRLEDLEQRLAAR